MEQTKQQEMVFHQQVWRDQWQIFAVSQDLLNTLIAAGAATLKNYSGTTCLEAKLEKGFPPKVRKDLS